jgi:hypothetical protein
MASMQQEYQKANEEIRRLKAELENLKRNHK